MKRCRTIKYSSQPSLIIISDCICNNIQTDFYSQELEVREETLRLQAAIQRKAIHWHGYHEVRTTPMKAVGFNDSEHENQDQERVPFLPMWIRLLLFCSAALMALSCFLTAMASDACFAEYKITDRIGDKLGGNPLNVIKLFGWFVLGGCFLSCVLLGTVG